MEIRTEDIREWEALGPDDVPRLRQLTAYRDGHEAGKVKVADSPICEEVLRRMYPDTPMVYQLYVDEALRNQRIGSALMDVAEQLIRDDGKLEILLCVSSDNSVAQDMYRRRGYKHIQPDGERYIESIWQLRRNGVDRIKKVQVMPMIKTYGKEKYGRENAS